MNNSTSKNPPWTILLYYQYAHIELPEKFAYEHLKLCKKLGLKGRILVANNGINGTVGGPKEATDQYMEIMHTNKIFQNMEFKTSENAEPCFKKMFVRYRPELVTMKYSEMIDPNKDGGKYIEPEDLNKLYENNEDFVIIDMRNDYEARIGRFQNAIIVPMKNFKELPEIVDKELIQYKNKKVITYCTGGIRCETATGLLKKKGFKDVSQLHGGVHKYGEKFPNSYWNGKLFVFDERMGIAINDNILANCEHCNKPYDDYINCINAKCNKLIILCPDCRIQMNDACSETCAKTPRSKNTNRLVLTGI